MNNSELVCNLTPSGKLAKSMSMDILFYLRGWLTKFVFTKESGRPYVILIAPSRAADPMSKKVFISPSRVADPMSKEILISPWRAADPMSKRFLFHAAEQPTLC